MLLDVTPRPGQVPVVDLEHRLLHGFELDSAWITALAWGKVVEEALERPQASRLSHAHDAGVLGEPRVDQSVAPADEHDEVEMYHGEYHEGRERPIHRAHERVGDGGSRIYLDLSFELSSLASAVDHLAVLRCGWGSKVKGRRAKVPDVGFRRGLRVRVPGSESRVWARRNI